MKRKGTEAEAKPAAARAKKGKSLKSILSEATRQLQGPPAVEVVQQVAAIPAQAIVQAKSDQPKEPKEKTHKKEKDKKDKTEKKEKKEKKDKPADQPMTSLPIIVPPPAPAPVVQPDDGTKKKDKKDKKEKKDKAKEKKDKKDAAGPTPGTEVKAPTTDVDNDDFWLDLTSGGGPLGPSTSDDLQARNNDQEMPDAPLAEEPEIDEAAIAELEAEEVALELDEHRPRIVSLSSQEAEALRADFSELLRKIERLSPDAKISLLESAATRSFEVHVEGSVPGAARLAELRIRAALANLSSSALELRVLPTSDGVHLEVLDIPASAAGSVDPKELQKHGDVIVAFMKQKAAPKQRRNLTAAQVELGRLLGLSLGQAVEVRYDESWFHANVIGFSENGSVKVEWLGGGEAELPAVDVRAATSQPKVSADSGPLLILSDNPRLRLVTRLRAAVAAERRAVATGAVLASGSSAGLAEELMGHPKAFGTLGIQAFDDDFFGISLVELPFEVSSTTSVKRRGQVASASEAIVETLSGGRRALIAGDIEERRRAHTLLTQVLPKAGPFGDISELPEQLYDHCSHLRVPNVAVNFVREKLQKAEEETGCLVFWLPPGTSAPRRETVSLSKVFEPGMKVEALYEGSWHGATVISTDLDENVEIAWDYNSSQSAVPATTLRTPQSSSGSSAGLQPKREAWLKSTRTLVAVGPERARIRCILRAMAATENPCPGLWSGNEEAILDAQVELRDGHSEEDVLHSFSVVRVSDPTTQLDETWLRSTDGEVALRTAEVAASCGLQLTAALAPAPCVLLLAGETVERERGLDYLQWAQSSRQAIPGSIGLRAGGSLNIMDADMRDDVLIVLLPETQAIWLRLDRLAQIEEETKTLLVFDKGGGTVLETGTRRLLVCGADDESRLRAASLARKAQEFATTSLASDQQKVPSQTASSTITKTDPWAVLQTMAWPENINKWGTLQKVVWAGHPKLAQGWIRVMSKSRREEYYFRLRDKQTTFDINEVLA